MVSSDRGTIRPSASAILRLIISSNFVDRSIDRQIGGLRALEDAAGIDADLAQRVRRVGPVAHQLHGVIDWKGRPLSQ